MVELVIKILEELYKAYKGRPPMLGDAGMDMIVQSIVNGTPLSKDHGKLIDADKLIKSIEKKSKRLKNLDTINGLCGAVALIYDAEVIIEADKVGDTDENG